MIIPNGEEEKMGTLRFRPKPDRTPNNTPPAPQPDANNQAGANAQAGANNQANNPGGTS